MIPLTDEEKSTIVRLRLSKFKYRQIAEFLGRDASCISRAFENWKILQQKKIDEANKTTFLIDAPEPDFVLKFDFIKAWQQEDEALVKHFLQMA
jgi:hypothetical protein